MKRARRAFSPPQHHAASGRPGQSGETVPVFISSRGIETMTETVLEDGKPVARHYVRGSVNGQSFTVPCNRQTHVAPFIAEALKGLLEAQARG